MFSRQDDENQSSRPILIIPHTLTRQIPEYNIYVVLETCEEILG